MATSQPNTVVTSGGTITDAAGNNWSLNNGQVVVNGQVDTTTARVIELSYAHGQVWQENSSNLWWAKTSPSDTWSPDNGTVISPLTPSVGTSPDNTVVQAGSQQTISDASGVIWGIDKGQVTVNGVSDPTTSNVTELAYEKGVVWQENSSNLWWGKSTLSDRWNPGYGTSVSPIPNVGKGGSSTIVQTSPDGTVAIGSNTVTDSRGVTWGINKTGQVTVNGITDSTTSNVIELAYVNGAVWQENSQKLWWEKTTPTDVWSPQGGTTSSPLRAPDSNNSNGVGGGGVGGVPSPDNTVIVGGQSFTDAQGNVWGIGNGNGNVTLNGVSDLTTVNVKKLLTKVAGSLT